MWKPKFLYVFHRLVLPFGPLGSSPETESIDLPFFCPSSILISFWSIFSKTKASFSCISFFWQASVSKCTPRPWLMTINNLLSENFSQGSGYGQELCFSQSYGYGQELCFPQTVLLHQARGDLMQVLVFTCCRPQKDFSQVSARLYIKNEVLEFLLSRLHWKQEDFWSI